MAGHGDSHRAQDDAAVLRLRRGLGLPVGTPVRLPYQTIPPECQCCGVMDHEGCDVDDYPELSDDPHWPVWLCPRCRKAQQAGVPYQECN